MSVSEIVFSKLDFGTAIPSTVTTLTLTFELSAMLRVSEKLLLRLLGFSFESDAIEVVGHNASATWDSASSIVELSMNVPLLANSRYVLTLLNVKLPGEGLNSTSTTCSLSSADVAIPWTLIQELPTLTGKISNI